MNSLEYKLGLVETSAADLLYQEPTASRLEKVPKSSQTYDMLLHVCKHDGNALKYASKKLITPELCEVAVKENGLALQFIPDRIMRSASRNWITEICKAAVSSNGQSLKYVPTEFMDSSIIELALLGNCKKSRDDYAIKYVPDNLLTKELVYSAVEHFPEYLRDIPDKRITKKLSEVAVEHDGLAIRLIPHRLVSESLALAAIAQNAMAIRYIPQEYITPELCRECFERECAVLRYLPLQYITKEMCLTVIEKRRFLVSDIPDSMKKDLFGTTNVRLVFFDDIPEKLRNDRDILDAIIPLYKFGSTEVLKWNAKVTEEFEKYQYNRKNKRDEDVKPLQKKTIAYLKTKTIQQEEDKEKSNKKEVVASIMKSNLIQYAANSQLSLPKTFPRLYSLAPTSNDEPINHDLSQSDYTSPKIFYVSDIHLEHQLPEELESIPMDDRMSFTIDFITQKVCEMVSGIPENRDNILLIGGDVADNIYLSEIFYDILREHWTGGTIIAILGNHELWERTSAIDTLVRIFDHEYKPRPAEDIVADYRKMIHSGWWLNRQYQVAGYDRPTSWNLPNHLYVNSVLLENELYIRYQGRLSRVIHEDEILEASVEELTEVLAKCTLILLGGIGFSGLNPEWNATAGLYSKTVESLDEDNRLTEKFRRVYEKVELCASDRKVIVLTHTPVYDWTFAPCNKNWIYVNGHTHQNILCLDETSTVFSDNQIGYKQQKWKLNSFTVDNCWYDPFAKYEDGIYKITSDQYRDFNRGRGILSNGCNYEGTLFMLKRGELYMFLLQSTKSLCLMAGGKRNRLANGNIQYYFDNMVLYREKVNEKTEPYRNVLRSLSKEIKKIGGIGTIHGCIVDVSFFSHLYVNPYDGKITPYWALDIMSRLYYNDFQTLLESHEPELLQKFLIEKETHSLPLISAYVGEESNIPQADVVPQWMSGTEIYQSSRILKAFQYVWEQNVIRIWNDDLLHENKIDTKQRMIE